MAEDKNKGIMVSLLTAWAMFILHNMERGFSCLYKFGAFCEGVLISFGVSPAPFLYNGLVYPSDGWEHIDEGAFYYSLHRITYLHRLGFVCDGPRLSILLF